MSPLDTQLILDELRKLHKLFEKFDARCAKQDDVLESSQGVPVPTQSAAVGAGVVADNWGGLFEPVPVLEERVYEPMKEQLVVDAHIVTDNWGGVFEEPARVMEECDYEPAASNAASPRPEKEQFTVDAAATEYTSDDPDAPTCVTAAPTVSAADSVSAVPASVETSPAEYQSQIRDLEKPSLRTPAPPRVSLCAIPQREVERSRVIIARAKQERHAAIIRAERLGASGHVFVGANRQQFLNYFAPDDPDLIRCIRLGPVECALRATTLGGYDGSLDDDPESGFAHFDALLDRTIGRVAQAPAAAAALRADAVGDGGGGLLDGLAAIRAQSDAAEDIAMDLDMKLLGSARYRATSGQLVLPATMQRRGPAATGDVLHLELKLATQVVLRHAHLVFDKMPRRYNTIVSSSGSNGAVLFGPVSVEQEDPEVFEEMAKHIPELLWPPLMHISNMLCTAGVPSAQSYCRWDAVLYRQQRPWPPPVELWLENCDAGLPSFNSVVRSFVLCHSDRLWKPPWYVSPQQQISGVLAAVLELWKCLMRPRRVVVIPVLHGISLLDSEVMAASILSKLKLVHHGSCSDKGVSSVLVLVHHRNSDQMVICWISGATKTSLKISEHLAQLGIVCSPCFVGVVDFGSTDDEKPEKLEAHVAAVHSGSTTDASLLPVCLARWMANYLLLHENTGCVLIQKRVQRKCGGLICSQPWLPLAHEQLVQRKPFFDISFDAVHLRPIPWPFFHGYAAHVHLKTSLNTMLVYYTPCYFGFWSLIRLGWIAVQYKSPWPPPPSNGTWFQLIVSSVMSCSLCQSTVPFFHCVSCQECWKLWRESLQSAEPVAEFSDLCTLLHTFTAHLHAPATVLLFRIRCSLLTLLQPTKAIMQLRHGGCVTSQLGLFQVMGCYQMNIQLEDPWPPSVWACSSTLMLTSSVLLGALLITQSVSLVFCSEVMLQYNADCLSSTSSEPEFLQFPWDPGGSILLHRLGGKPSLKERGMSAVSYGWAVVYRMGLSWSPVQTCWGTSKASEQDRRRHQQLSNKPNRFIPFLLQYLLFLLLFIFFPSIPRFYCSSILDSIAPASDSFLFSSTSTRLLTLASCSSSNTVLQDITCTHL